MCRVEARVAPAFMRSDLRTSVLQEVGSLERTWNHSVKAAVRDRLLMRKGIDTVIADATTRDGLFHINLHLPDVVYKGKPVIIELIDKEHMCVNVSRVMGRWHVRQQILSKYGYHVLALSLVQWENDYASRSDQLDALLAGCKVRSFDGLYV